jgi:hypothetical protein
VDEDSQKLLTNMIEDLDRRNLNSNPIYHEELFNPMVHENAGDPLPLFRIQRHSMAETEKQEHDRLVLETPPLEDHNQSLYPIPLSPKPKNKPEISRSCQILTESRILVPTPVYLTEDHTEATQEDYANVEFYLATLKLHIQNKSKIRRKSKAKEGNANYFENLTLPPNLNRVKEIGHGEFQFQVSELFQKTYINVYIVKLLNF